VELAGEFGDKHSTMAARRMKGGAGEKIAKQSIRDIDRGWILIELKVINAA